MNNKKEYILTQEHLDKLIEIYADEDVNITSKDVLSELIGKAFFDGDSTSGESYLYSINHKGLEKRRHFYDD